MFLVFSVAPASAATLEQTLQEFIRGGYPWAQVEVSEITSRSEVPGGMPVRIYIEQGPPGRTVFALEYPGGVKVQVVANVKAFDPVVLALRSFKKGHRLRKDDVYTSLMDVSRIPRDAVRNADLVVGRQLSRSVSANTALAEQMVTDTDLVRRGKKVMIVTSSEGFSISAVGELKENAMVGSTVKAINTASRRQVTGVLVDESTVKVEF